MEDGDTVTVSSSEIHVERFAIRCLAAALILIGLALPIFAQTPFITDVDTAVPLRNNYDGYVGMQFTVGAVPIVVSSFGRVYVPGNSAAHSFRLISLQTGLQVGNTINLTMTSAAANTYEYTALPAPLQLSPNTSYYLLCEEFSGGDQWYDLAPVTTSGLTLNAAAYTSEYAFEASTPPGPAVTAVTNTTGYSYGPVNFLYTVPAAGQPVITSPSPNQLLSAPNVYPFTVQFSATNQTQGATLQFQIDGQNFGPPATYPIPSTYSLTVDPTLIYQASTQRLLTAVYSTPGNSPVTSPAIPFNISYNAASNVTSLQPISGSYGPYPPTSTPLRNNFGRFVGMQFTTGNQPMVVTDLGRPVWPSNTQSHLLKLVDATTGSDVPGASATVNTSDGTSGRFAYAYFLTPVTLKANWPYYVLCQENLGGDFWAEIAPISVTSGTVNGPVYQAEDFTYSLVTGAPGKAYELLNFDYRNAAVVVPPTVSLVSPTFTNGYYGEPTLSGTITVQATATPYQGANPPLTIVSYQLQIDGQPVGASSSSGSISLNTALLTNGNHTLIVAATDSAGTTGYSSPFTVLISNTTPPFAFVTSVSHSVQRNNYSGWVGMNFTVGSSPLQVTSLGRYCITGNSGAHSIKLVLASSGADVAGASGIVQMANCGTTPTPYVYASLQNAVTLPAGNSYYLVDQETAGGDFWYDYSPVASSGAGTINGSVYTGANGAYAVVPAPSTSYVPLNFLYTAGSGTTSSLNVAISSVTYGSPTVVNATANGSSTVTSVQIQVDGFSLTPPLTTAPYSQTFPFSLNYGPHVFTAIATDSSGNTAVSAGFQAALTLPYTANANAQINFTPGPLRNNYSGWVGFQFTMGSSVLLNFPGSTEYLTTYSPNAMGRACLSSNTQAHIVKVVLASTGADVPGASTVVDCTSSAQQSGLPFGPLLTGLSLNTTYYLVSQEFAGGDQFSDIGPATGIINIFGDGSTQTRFVSNITINGPVYFNGSNWVLVPTPNYSYAGLTFYGFTSPI